jgi:hypothetical protein
MRVQVSCDRSAMTRLHLPSTASNSENLSYYTIPQIQRYRPTDSPLSPNMSAYKKVLLIGVGETVFPTDPLPNDYTRTTYQILEC